MIHVFVESNWVVEVCAPSFRRSMDALSLLQRAERGEITIHVPHIALREAQDVIRRKHQPNERKTLQQFRKWAVEHGHVDEATSRAANQLLTEFSNIVTAELKGLSRRIDEVAEASGVQVFGLSDSMLSRSISLRNEVPEPHLKPFDEVILAAILVRAEEIASAQCRLFCTLDFDLAPVVRDNTRRHLVAVYNRAQLQVRTSFNLDDIAP